MKVEAFESNLYCNSKESCNFVLCNALRNPDQCLRCEMRDETDCIKTSP